MEETRLRGVAIILAGGSQSFAARSCNVSRTSASRWAKAARTGGADSLKRRKAPGRPKRYTPEQERLIRKIYAIGPVKFGSLRDRWTNAFMAEVLEKALDLKYDPDHVGRLLDQLGLKKQKKRSEPRRNMA